MVHAERTVVCWPRLGGVAILLFALSGCGGTIVFGTGQNDASTPGDGGPQRDATTYPDAMIDPDGGPLPDADAATEVCSYPAMYPHERTKEAFENMIGTWARTSPQSCTLSVCHAMTNKPLLPPDPATLNNDVILQRAIDDLWADIVPGDDTAKLIFNHNGNSVSWTYTPAELEHVRMIVANAKYCVMIEPPDGGDAGPADAELIDGAPVDGGVVSDGGPISDGGPTDI